MPGLEGPGWVWPTPASAPSASMRGSQRRSNLACFLERRHRGSHGPRPSPGGLLQPAWTLASLGCSPETKSRIPGLVWSEPAVDCQSRDPPPLLRLTLRALILALDLEGPDSVLQGVHCPGFGCDAPAGRHRYVGSLHRSRSGG